MSKQDWRKQKFSLTEKSKDHLIELANVLATRWYTNIVEELEDLNIISPPEQMFYAQWLFEHDYDEISLEPQDQIGDYYVDFGVNILRWFIEQDEPDNPINLEKVSKHLEKIVVEIDGHWHEKSPEQVEKDKKRERFLVGQGFTVFRFSAREIFNDPRRCVEEVWQFAYKQLREVRKRFYAGEFS